MGTENTGGIDSHGSVQGEFAIVRDPLREFFPHSLNSIGVQPNQESDHGLRLNHT